MIVSMYRRRARPVSTTPRRHAVSSAAEANRAEAFPRIRHLIVAAMALTAMVVAGPVFADSNTCSSNSHSGGTVTFTLPSEIVVPQNGATSGPLWTSPPTTPVNPPSFSSCGTNVPNGLENATWGGPSVGDNTLYPTSLSWLAFRILQSGTALLPYGLQPSPTSVGAINAQISSPFQLQLVITGSVPPGNQTLPTGQLILWDFQLGGGTIFTVETFRIGGSGAINIIQPCVIAVNPTTVTLPTVATSAFAGGNSTTGTKPFSIDLTNCPTGNQLGITLNTSNPQPGTTSVIQNTAATSPATGVGVQLLDGAGNPVTFGNAIPEGTISGATVNLPFTARYYQSGTTVTPGDVTAVATYTLTYQ
jgi:type 1 fimbria pilin